MKKLLLVAFFLLTCAVALPRVSAQSAMFTYTGVPSGPVNPNSTITIGVNLVFTSGGGFTDVQGFSLWMAQRSPASGFPFFISSRDTTGSLFTPGLVVFPQMLDPINRNSNGTQVNTDLGGSAANPLPSGTYFIANYMFFVGANALPGTYTIGNTTSNVPGVGGRISVIADHNGNTINMAASNFDITVIPEPGSSALMAVGALGAGLAVCGRRIRRG